MQCAKQLILSIVMVMAAVGKHDVSHMKLYVHYSGMAMGSSRLLRNVNVVTPNLPQIYNFTFASFVTCILYASRGISAVIDTNNIMFRYDNHYVKTHNCLALVTT